MRIGAGSAGCILDLHIFKEPDCPPAGSIPGNTLVHDHGFANLATNSHYRIEMGRGVLKDHRCLLAAKPVEIGAAHRQNVSSIEENAPRLHLRVAGKEPQNGSTGNGLARSRLSDNAQYFPRAQGEGHAAQGAHRPEAGGKIDCQIFDLNEMTACRMPGHDQGPVLSRRASPSAVNDSPSASEQTARPGKIEIHHAVVR